MTNATLITDSARPAIRLERHLNDPPAVVWRALTEQEQLRSWFPCDVIVEGGRWKVGAAITFPFPEDVIDMTLEGEVLEVDEPRVLAFTWGDEKLRFELSSEDEGTRLVLIDELEAGAAARNAAGWDVCLDRLARSSTAIHGDRAFRPTRPPSSRRSVRKRARLPATKAAEYADVRPGRRVRRLEARMVDGRR